MELFLSSWLTTDHAVCLMVCVQGLLISLHKPWCPQTSETIWRICSLYEGHSAVFIKDILQPPWRTFCSLDEGGFAVSVVTVKTTALPFWLAKTITRRWKILATRLMAYVTRIAPNTCSKWVRPCNKVARHPRHALMTVQLGIIHATHVWTPRFSLRKREIQLRTIPHLSFNWQLGWGENRQHDKYWHSEVSVCDLSSSPDVKLRITMSRKCAVCQKIPCALRDLQKSAKTKHQ